MATDLHDGVGSLLSAARLYVQQLSTQRSTEDFEEILGEAKSIVDTAIQQTREISHNLLPTVLDRFGLLQALEDHCKKIEQSSGLEVNLSYDQEYQFTKEQDLALYRIVQELINNTPKHAEAKQITIQFESIDQDIKLIYSDDGKGIGKEAKGNGVGMKSIESRVNLIGGRMEMESEKGNGFRFLLHI